MRRSELRKNKILKRVFNSSVATSFARTLRLVGSETQGKPNSRVYLEKLTKPYIPYEDQTKIKIQLLEVEKQKAEAISLVQRHNYT
jgi:hypothetical protein